MFASAATSAAAFASLSGAPSGAACEAGRKHANVAYPSNIFDECYLTSVASALHCHMNIRNLEKMTLCKNNPSCRIVSDSALTGDRTLAVATACHHLPPRSAGQASRAARMRLTRCDLCSAQHKPGKVAAA